MSWYQRTMLVIVAAFAAGCSDVQTPTAVVSPDAGEQLHGSPLPAEQAPSPHLLDVILAINAQTGEFSTAIQALTSAGLLDPLTGADPLTVFAPTDAAFAKLGLNPGNVGTLPTSLLTSLLLFHVAPGRLDAATVVGSDRIRMLNGSNANVRVENGEVFLNNARVIQVDVEATNGVIHVLDAVLLRPASSPTTVDVLLEAYSQTGEFSTLIAAVVAADLVGPLSSQGQGTVFAPTDAAFADIGLNASNVGDIPRETLLDILGFHIAPGRRDAASVVASTQLRMANGQWAAISIIDGQPFIENARIIATDIPSTNSIIHVIDAVLLP